MHRVPELKTIFNFAARQAPDVAVSFFANMTPYLFSARQDGGGAP
jgi:hypothetical protein